MIPPTRSNRRLQRWCVLSTVALLAAAVPVWANGSPLPQAASGAASSQIDLGSPIAAEDLLDITVLGQPELTKSLTVSLDGKINFPYLGEFKVSGLTANEVQRRMTLGLDAHLIRPQVIVTIAKRPEKFVNVLGPMKTPGKHIIKDGWRLLDLIIDCGGPSTDRPEWVSATLVRGGGAEAIPVDIARILNRTRSRPCV